MANMRELIDRLEHGRDGANTKLTSAAAAAAPSKNPHGLVFAVGDRVVDLVTGKRGTVMMARRDDPSGDELFRLLLADGSAQWRSGAQLEVDPSAPAVR